MSKVPYTKPALTYEQLLNQLKNRGLTIEDEKKASHLLEVISYYRLSGYWYPLLSDKKNHQFKSGSTFNTAFKLYCFDRELRQMVLAELEKIEVAIRSKMTYILSHKHGPFWFQNASLFSNPVLHANALTKIGEEFKRSDEDFINSFRNKYSDPLPPSWMTTEITSFGALSMLYKNLRPGREKREIANYFGLPDTVFETWLHSIVYLRNVCAHHTRLWNRAMSIRPQIPRSPRKTWLQDPTSNSNRTYFILSMINYLLQTVNPTNTFRIRFKKLLLKYNNVDIKALGFPTNREQEPLWK
jgi:abortive infection bacteriophage resistance protein